MAIPAAHVTFSRPDIDQRDIDAVAAALRSGRLTSGPCVRDFEEAFRTAVRSNHALAVNSCSAAMHLALEALGTKPGDAVLVPTMTFAATAEAVRHMGAMPVLVDCDPVTLGMDLTDAVRKVEQLNSHTPPGRLPWGLTLVGMMPVHVSGLMLDIDAVQELATQWGVWVVEDAAHAFPAAWRSDGRRPWRQCGEGTATVTCFSFSQQMSAEGGTAVTNHEGLAARMRQMALHGLAVDVRGGQTAHQSWDYRILAPGFKYGMTEMVAALAAQQLDRADAMRARREQVAERYLFALADLDEIELPPSSSDRVHAWHLFSIQLRLNALDVDRAGFIDELASLGVDASVYWRPLHLHPYYRHTFGWHPGEFPVATSVWERLVSLPIFSSMTDGEVSAVIAAVRRVCMRHRRPGTILSWPDRFDIASLGTD